MANGNDTNALAERDPEELFRLKWNDFTDNVMSTMSDIRHDEDFFDVTIAIDGRQLRAHKLILSACSAFFRKLLRTNPAPNPVLVLWDVSYDDMLNILDFMYNGEVHVKQANIQNFLAVAEKFRVRGLCQNESSGQPSRSNTPQPRSPTSTGSSVPPKKRQKRDSGSINEPEVAIKDFAKNLKDESDITSPVQPQSSTASMAAVQLPPGLDGGREPKQEPHHHNMGIVDDQDETSTSNASMASKFDEKTGSNNSGASANPFLGMAAASLMDPSAAKEFWRHFGLNPAMGSAMIAAQAAQAGGGGTGSSVSQAQGAGSNNGPGGSPGGGSGNGGSGLGTPDGSGLRKPRSVYTSEQINHLETFFRMNEYIDGERKRKLAQLTTIPEHQIKVWFQNRRQKKKREAEAVEQQMFQHQPQHHSLFPQQLPPQNIGSIDAEELSS